MDPKKIPFLVIQQVNWPTVQAGDFFLHPMSELKSFCRCHNRFAYWSRSASQVVSDNCCTSNTAALKLQTNIDDEMCLKYCSYHNKVTHLHSATIP